MDPLLHFPTLFENGGPPQALSFCRSGTDPNVENVRTKILHPLTTRNLQISTAVIQPLQLVEKIQFLSQTIASNPKQT